MTDSAEVTLRLPALPESVPTARTRARRFVRVTPTREDALALLVTELVGSVVTGGPPTSARVVELTLSEVDHGVRVTARRTDSEVVGLGDPEVGDLSTRLLDRLADGWGDDDGMRWFELRTRVAGGAQPSARRA